MPCPVNCPWIRERHSRDFHQLHARRGGVPPEFAACLDFVLQRLRPNCNISEQQTSNPPSTRSPRCRASMLMRLVSLTPSFSMKPIPSIVRLASYMRRGNRRETTRLLRASRCELRLDVSYSMRDPGEIQKACASSRGKDFMRADL